MSSNVSTYSQRFQLTRNIVAKLIARGVLPKTGKVRFDGFAWVLEQLNKAADKPLPSADRCVERIIARRAAKAARIEAARVASEVPAPANEVALPTQLPLVAAKKKKAAKKSKNDAAVEASLRAFSGENLVKAMEAAGFRI